MKQCHLSGCSRNSRCDVSRPLPVCCLWLLAIAIGFAMADITALPVDSAEVPAAVLEAERARIDAVRKASASTLAIFGPAGGGGGSGVVISPDGYALTNFHVTQPLGNALKCGMDDGILYDAVIVGVDPTGDVALIKLFGRDDFPAAEWGNSDQVRAGDWALVIGNPFLLATDFKPTVSFGLISGVHRYQYPAGTLLEYADCLQTDAAINPGNSGGPLFDSKGALIGINGRGSFEKRGRVNVGVGYAISINQIKKFLSYLRSGRIADHATLGALVSSDEDGRVVVSDILENSDAYRRGLRVDDEIVQFANRPVRTVNEFKNILGTLPKLWQVPLEYRRAGETRTIQVRLAGVHGAGELAQRLKQRPTNPDGNPPHEMPHAAASPKMPPIVKAHFEPKEGYANYYFNRFEQDRIAEAWLPDREGWGEVGDWKIEGTFVGEGVRDPFEIELRDKFGSANLPHYQGRADFRDSLFEYLDPPGTGGLLVALHLWQRLLQRGIAEFGGMEYVGRVPDGETGSQFEMLRAFYGGVEVRFLFNPQGEQLEGLEMFAEEDLDPCEIRFKDYRRSAGKRLPTAIEVRQGDQQYGTFEINRITTIPAPAETP
ncbi:MAG: serine protease [Planctomycetaceae bacterium]|nr:serine protease [Planctomycetaceae bacterium]